jgi:hypothetical protein
MASRYSRVERRLPMSFFKDALRRYTPLAAVTRQAAGRPRSL